MAWKPLILGDKRAKYPIVQGGMGVGVSRSRLAGAVAAAGGIGIISTAQIGYDEPDFEQDVQGCNLRAIEKHIRLAKEQAKEGLVGVNVMVALQHYADHVRTAARAGADLIVCGAGLPVDLPKLVEGTKAKIAPVISSKKAADILLRMWDKKYHRTADMLVAEGPKAGGHLGFSREELTKEEPIDFDARIREIIEAKKPYEEKYGIYIPVVAGGGISERTDAEHIFGLGADGIQVATRFVATEECDASDAYKQAYLDAKEEDVVIINSPVGMPGRALRNAFIRQVEEQGNVLVKKCYQCIKKCNPVQIPYCITQALVNAVKGELDRGLIFCGADVGKLTKIQKVEDIIRELVG